jgi:hypothetical protein
MHSGRSNHVVGRPAAIARTAGFATGLLVAISLLFPRWGVADDALTRVTFTGADKETRTVSGKILVEAVDRGILVLGRDGRLWNITPEQLQSREQSGGNFKPFSSEELGQRLKAEFGDEFEIVTTKHYVICTSAGKQYAVWCGTLFERLMSKFLTHWRTKKLGLREPPAPLTAIVFANERQFADFAAKDAGADATDAKGYYSIRTNRIVLYDLTADGDSRPARTIADINRKVEASLFNVATVVHEATHQIAFNTGLHTRYADNPMWLTEGMALYFETPDLKSRTGWKTAGKVNRSRLRQFQDFVRNRRKSDSLSRLLADNQRFSDAKQIEDAYAEAWAFTYFLIKTKRRRYVAYLQHISQKPQLNWDTPQERLTEFKAVFGEDLGKLDRQFLRFMRRLRPR